MKNGLNLGIAMTVLAGLSLAGCSSSPPSSTGDTPSGTVTGIYDIGYKSTIDPIIAEFQKKYPGVEVKMNYTGDVQSVLSTQLQAGTAPDILLAFPGGTAGDTTSLSTIPLASLGRLMDLSSDSWTNEIPAAWKAKVSHEGKVYAYPGAVQPLAAIYNQDELNKLGLKVPTTLDEVYELCSDAKNKGVYAYAQGLGDAEAGPQMLSFGQTASLVYGPTPDFSAKAADGSATYKDSPWVEQFTIYKKMYDLGCFGDGSLGRTRQQGAEAVSTGKALAQVDVGGQMGIMQGLAPNTHFEVAAIPATNDGKNFVTALPSSVLAVNAKAKNPVAAKAFLAFLAEPAQSVTYAKGFSSVPIIPNSEYTPPANLKTFAELVSSGNFAQLADFKTNAVQVALNQGVQSMLLGKLTPEQVAESMQKASEG